MPSPFISVICFREEGMIHFFYRSHAKQPFFWLNRKQYGWFALFRWAEMPPSVSCCWFQFAFWIHKRVRYEIFLEFKSVSIEISSVIEIFSISSYTKTCGQKFTDHLNAIWYWLQVTEATNSVPDTDLEIREGGGGGAVTKKNFFPPFGAQFGLTKRRAREPPLYGGPQLARQNQKLHGKNKNITAKTKYLTAKPKTARQKQNTSRPNQKPHGKTKNFTTKTK